jgi:hypothetical protein
MIAFVGCVKSKKDHPCKAEEMYTSDLFKKGLAYAKKNASKVYILSARYGLVKLDEVISPYQETLNTKTREQQKKWAYKVYLQLKQEHVDFNEAAIFLCGENYRRYLMQLFKNSFCPIEGLSFGKILKFYKEKI